jgi:putative peptidoglycan lipid II flippase
MSAFTLTSRILGYARDLVFAFIFGASANADSFLLAFRLPNLFRRLFAEGAINNAFIPLFLDIKKKVNKRAAQLFSNYVFSYLILLLLIVTVLVEFFMKDIVGLLAPGFSEDLLNKTTFLASVMFPYLILISISSFIGALLNAEGRFALWAFSPIILNICMILALGLSYFYLLIPGVILSWAVILSGVLQIFLMLFWAYKKNIKVQILKPRNTKDVKKFFYLLVPNILAGGIFQINQFIGIIFASSITGAISWLYYADRIVQLPLGVFIVSISTILLTVLSKQQTNKFKDTSNNTIDSAFLSILCLTLICMIGLFVLSDLIVDILFKRGKFGLGDVLATSDAIIMYAIGLPAFGFIKIFSIIFFSKKNTFIPFITSIFSVLLNLFFIILLTEKMGHLGIALALSLSSYINAIILYILILKNNYWHINKKLIKKVFKIILSAFLTYVVLFIFYMLILISEYFYLSGFMSKAITLVVLMSISVALFFSLLILLKVIDYKMLKMRKFKDLFNERASG